VYTGYYPTWSDNWFSSTDWQGNKLSDDAILKASKLARLPATYTHVSLSFADPAGGASSFGWQGLTANVWTGTGLNFNAAPVDIAAAISILHKRNIKVVLAVGGATYGNWSELAAEGAAGSGTSIASLAQLMKDLVIDGLEVDYEVGGTDTATVNQYANSIKALRIAATQGGGTLSLAAWSTGADCTVATGTSAKACGGTASYWSGNAGRERLVFGGTSPLVNPAVVDFLNVMSYDAQTNYYDGVTAWNLYRDMFPNTTTVSIGFETAPEGWAGGMLVVHAADAQCAGSVIAKDQFWNVEGTSSYTYSVERYANAVKNHVATTNFNPRDGAMLWQVLKTATAACGSAAVASPGTIAAEISAVFGLPLDSRDAWQ
jgi:GH18 family chitinase